MLIKSAKLNTLNGGYVCCDIVDTPLPLDGIIAVHNRNATLIAGHAQSLVKTGDSVLLPVKNPDPDCVSHAPKGVPPGVQLHDSRGYGDGFVIAELGFCHCFEMASVLQLKNNLKYFSYSSFTCGAFFFSARPT